MFNILWDILFGNHKHSKSGIKNENQSKERPLFLSLSICMGAFLFGLIMIAFSSFANVEFPFKKTSIFVLVAFGVGPIFLKFLPYIVVVWGLFFGSCITLMTLGDYYPIFTLFGFSVLPQYILTYLEKKEHIACGFVLNLGSCIFFQLSQIQAHNYDRLIMIQYLFIDVLFLICGFPGFLNYFELTKAKKDLASSLKRLKKKSKSKDRFFASASHDLRNPLNSLLGSIELLEALIEDDDECQEYIQTAKLCINTALQFINNILDASKIEEHKFELNPNIEELRRIVEELNIIFSPIAKKKNLFLKINYSSIIPQFLQIDKVRLMQVLTNLISNSVKFTQSGGVFLTFSWTPISGNQEDKTEKIISEVMEDHFNEYYKENTISTQLRKFSSSQKSSIYKEFISINDSENCGHSSSYEMKGLLKIECHDTGIGVKKENLEKLFHPYSQAESSIYKTFGGTGLGLWISKSIIECMKGKIIMLSKFNEGSKTIIIVPINVSPEGNTPIIPSIEKITDTNNYIKDKKILYVEDQEIVRRTNLAFLKMQKLNITVAFDGAEGFHLFQEKKSFDIILTDLRMPQMNGNEMVKKIRDFEHQNGLPQTPAIILSGEHSDAIKIDCFKCGCQEYLIKPVSLLSLKKSLEKIILSSSKKRNMNIPSILISKKKISGRRKMQKNKDSSILLLDSDLLSLSILTCFVKPLIGNIVTSTRITDAIELLKAQIYKWQIIIMDYNFIDGTGIDFLNQLIETDCYKSRHPILISLSTLTIAEQKKLYKKRIEKFDEFMEKPILKSQIEEIMNRYLEKNT